MGGQTGNRKAVGGTEEQPHGWWTDDWCGDFNVLRKFKQTHGRNCKSTATERERWKNECQTFWNMSSRDSTQQLTKHKCQRELKGIARININKFGHDLCHRFKPTHACICVIQI